MVMDRKIICWFKKKKKYELLLYQFYENLLFQAGQFKYFVGMLLFRCPSFQVEILLS